jgi:phage shock protein A
MGLFARLSGLVSAHLNALLDKAEDPERLLEQVVREMEQGLAVARQHAAAAVAAERRLGRELGQERARAAHWEGQARRALALGREDLARRALARRVEHADAAAALDPQYAAALRDSGEVRAALRALESRVAEARRRQRALLAGHRAVRARCELQRAAGADLLGLQSPFARFEQLERRLADTEDDLLARADVARGDGALEGELARLACARRIDDELEALKRGLTAGPGPTLLRIRAAAAAPQHGHLPGL